jgi:hypothetical protein
MATSISKRDLRRLIRSSIGEFIAYSKGDLYSLENIIMEKIERKTEDPVERLLRSTLSQVRKARIAHLKEYCERYSLNVSEELSTRKDYLPVVIEHWEAYHIPKYPPSQEEDLMEYEQEEGYSSGSDLEYCSSASFESEISQSDTVVPDEKSYFKKFIDTVTNLEYSDISSF